MLGRRGRGGGLVSNNMGGEEVGGLEGAVGGWRPDLVNKNKENNSVDKA